MKKLLSIFILSYFSINLSIDEWKPNDRSPNALCAAPNFQYAVAYSSDNEGNTFYAWADYRDDLIDIYAQKLNKRGVPQWTKDGLKVGRILDKNQFIYTSKLIKPDNNGGAFVVWHRCIDVNNTSRQALYAQKINPNGNTLWANGGIKLTEKELITIDSYDDIVEINDLKNDKLQFIFNHYNGASNAVYVKKLNNAGNTVEAETQLLESKGVQTKVQFDEISNRFVALIKNDGDFVYQAFDSSLKPLTQPTAFTQNTFSGTSRIDLFKIDNQGNTYVGRTFTGDGKKAVYAHKITKDGQLSWGNNGVNLGSTNAFDIQVSPTSDGGGICTWIELSDKQNPFRIARLNPNGSTKWQKNVFTPNTDKNYFLPNKLISDGKDGVYTLWLAPKEIGYNLTVQHFDTDGSPQFSSAGASINDFTFYSDYRLILHPTGGVIVLYGCNKELEDGRGGSVDLYTNYLSDKGVFGLPNTLAISSLSNPAVCAGNSSSVTVLADATFEKTNEFKVLLSDKDGNFGTNPIEIGRNTQTTIEFKVSNTLENGTYKIKVVSTAPVIETQTTDLKISKVTATATNSSPYMEGDEIKLSSSGGTKYEWSGPNGFTSNVQNPTIAKSTLAMAGTYTVKVSDANNCSSTAQTTVQINPILSRESENKLQVNIFPNPAQQLINYQFTALNNQKIKVVLTDLEGKILFENEVIGKGGKQEESIKIEESWHGNIMLKITTHQQVTSKKIFIE